MGTLLNRRRYMGVQKQEKVLFEMYNQYFNGTVSSVVDAGIKLWDGTHNSWKMEVVYQKFAEQANMLTTLFAVRPDYSPYSGIRLRKVNSNDIQLTISDTWSVIANEGGFDIYVNSTYGSALQKTELLDYNSLIIIRNGNTLFIDFNGYKAEVLITNSLTNNLNLLIGCDYKSNDNQTQRYYTGTVQKFVITELPATYDAEVEYIQGGIFDASFVPKSTGVHTWEYMFISKANYAYCFGTKPVESGKWMVFAGWNNNNAWSEILYGSSSVFGWNAANNVRYAGEMDMSGQTKTLKIDGSTKLSLSANSFANTNPFSFQLSKSGTITNRLYWYKIVEDGILKLDIIPVRIGSVGYLYDRVSGEIISNSDTITPVIGPDKT